MSGTIRNPKWRSLPRKNGKQPKSEKRPVLQSELLEDRLAPADLNWSSTVYFGNRTTSAVGYGDVNGDGSQDAVMAIGSQFYVYTNKTEKGPAHSFRVFEPGSRGSLQFAVADTTGDGRDDLHIKALLGRQRVNLFYDATQLVGTSPPTTPPTGTLGNGGAVLEGGTGSVSFANVTGGSGGYTFSFDFNSDGTFEVSNSAAATATVPASFLPDGPSSRTIRGRVTDSTGRFTDHTTAIQVNNAAPTAKLTLPGTATVGKAASFTATATDPSSTDQAAGFSYAWTFGDGSTGTGANPSHTYTAAGMYTVTVRATDKDGAVSAPVTTFLTVSLVVPPTGTFSNGGPVGEGGTGLVSFANVTGGSGGYVFSYDFNNDGTPEIANTTSATANVPASYLADGPFARVVSGRVVDSGGRFTDYTTTIQVNNLAPTAKLTGPSTTGAGQAAAFTALATDPSSADQTAGFIYAWTFGDGTTGTGANPTHVYSAAGTYTVTLRATDRDGSTSAAASATVTVTTGTSTSPPTAKFSNGGPVGEGSTGAVSFSSVTGGSGGYVFSYDFDNNGTFEVTGSTTASATVPASFLPDGPATRTVRGRVADNGGRFTDYTTAIQVNNVAPTAKVSGPGVSTAGKGAAFTASATDPGSVDQATGFTYAWTFGDGTTGSGANPSHTYSSPGTYSVTLRATDRNGATSAAATTALTVVDGNSESGVVVTPDWIITEHDKMPNFGGHPTLVAVQSGNWSDAATWGGRVPTAGEIVNIGSGVTITFDQVNDVELDTVSVLAGGTLQFRTDASTRLRVTNLLVLENGTLRIGTAADPVRAGVKAEIYINDVPIDTTRDPGQYGNGLIAFGKVAIHGAAMTDTYIRLATEPRAGHTTLTLSAPATGWRAGDRLLIPDTRQWNDRLTDNQLERPTIASVSADGRTVTLTAPLVYDHFGARDENNALSFAPHVANMSRSVVVRSENASGVRGHTFFTARADVDIRYAQFSGLGRTTNDPLNNARYDSNRNATSVGTNQGGRYSVYFNHLYGPSAVPANGYQFTFEGNAIQCPLDPMPFRWGVAINDSHYGLVKDNTLYNWAGAGIVTELGNETANVIEGNFVLHISGTGNRGDGRLNETFMDFAFEGTGIWLRGGNNFVRDNVVAGAYIYGVNIFAERSGTQFAPAFQGADPGRTGQGVTMRPEHTPLREFARNEVYGMTAQGLTVWLVGAAYGSQHNIGQSVIRDFRVWHMHQNGIFFYPANNFIVDGFVARNNWSKLPGMTEGGTGILFGDYLSANMTVRNADIQGFAIGIQGPEKPGDTGSTGQTIQPTVIENSYLRNRLNITIRTMNAVTGGGTSLAPRRLIVRDVLFATPNVAFRNDDIVANIRMECAIGRDNNVNFIQSDELLVYNYNRVAGDDFRVYYAEQAASYILPQTGTLNCIGSPVAGLTNQQNWSQYGIAMGGALAPATATTRTGIYGGLVNDI